MCGIAGFTTFFHSPPDAAKLIADMAELLRPRGPDGEGRHVEGHVALGHRRLSIIDLVTGAQPMSTPDGRYSVVYNGEIYNYVELRAELEARGAVFRTSSDTEVLLWQFAFDGIEALKKLNGIFAFAIWDKLEERLFLARDRVGVKPLYYATVAGDIVFASELKALLKHPLVKREIDYLSLSKYFTYTYVPAPAAIFKGVYKLEPGAYLVFDRAGLRKNIYWDIPLLDNPVNPMSLEEAAATLRDMLRETVRKQLRSDVPVGVFLSGGIDSSAITAVAAELAPKKISTFSIGFEESSYDESPFSRMVASRFGTEHHEEILSAGRALELLPKIMKIPDEPFGDASFLPTWLLSHFTARHVKVALSGDGGDELFAGYPAFQAHFLMEKLSVLPISWREGLVRLAKRLPVSHRYASVDFLAQQFFKGAGVSPEIRFFLWMGAYSHEQKQALFSPALKEQLQMCNPYEDILNYVRQSGLTRDFERLQYLCMKLYLQDGVLAKVDRASMANSLEVRVPLLDHALVEFAAQLHPNHKLRGLATKYVFKKAMAGTLPKAILRRRKAGFMIPLAAWLKNELRSMLEEFCSVEQLKADGFFEPRFVREMMESHFAGTRDYRKMLWTLLAFQIWHRNYGGKGF